MVAVTKTVAVLKNFCSDYFAVKKKILDILVKLQGTYQLLFIVCFIYIYVDIYAAT